MGNYAASANWREKVKMANPGQNVRDVVASSTQLKMTKKILTTLQMFCNRNQVKEVVKG